MTTEQKLKIAIEALTSIAFLDEPDALYYDYWIDNADLHEVVANDTVIARDALALIQSESVEVRKPREFWINPNQIAAYEVRPPSLIEDHDKFIHVREILDGGDQ